jgi:hypothetical protein
MLNSFDMPQALHAGPYWLVIAALLRGDRHIDRISPETDAALQMTDISDTSSRESRGGVPFVRSSDRYIEQTQRDGRLR